MTHVLPRPRIADVQVRWGMLLLVLAVNLPIPVVHTHDLANGTRQLALHVALFHSGRRGCDPHRLHVHMIPPSFFGGTGPGGATGDDAPGPERDKTCPPESEQVDAPAALDVIDQAVADWTVALREEPTGPRHFLETYAAVSDLGGLWGVCRC